MDGASQQAFIRRRAHSFESKRQSQLPFGAWKTSDLYRAPVPFKRRLIRNPNTDISHVLLAACYGHLGRFEDARAEWREAFRVNPNYSLEHRRQVLPYKNPADF